MVSDVTLDKNNNLYVVNFAPHDRRIAVFDPNGTFIKNIRFEHTLAEIDFDEEENMYVCNGEYYNMDDGMHQEGKVIKYSPQGQKLWEIKTYKDKPLSTPFGIRYSKTLKHILVTDMDNNRVIMLDKNGIPKADFSLQVSKSNDQAPWSFAMDEVQKTLYVSSPSANLITPNPHVQIWKWNP